MQRRPLLSSTAGLLLGPAIRRSSTSNDIAIAWPPQRKPIVVGAYLTGSTLSSEPRDAVPAEVGRITTTLLA